MHLITILLKFDVDNSTDLLYDLAVDEINIRNADIAQVVERYIGNVEVTGPTPVISFFLCPKTPEAMRLGSFFVIVLT